ncbi:hypothetical protein ABPG74_002923 [Tetrahymena malaccensis]
MIISRANKVVNQLILKQARAFSFEKTKHFKIGEIPESLKYDRPYKETILDNGIKVCSEIWPSPLCTVAAFIKCGSRSESEETSGTAHFLEHLHFKGTKKRSRQSLELEIENHGGQLNAYTSRENTCYTMNLFKNKLPWGVEVLSDILTQSEYSIFALNNERNTIHTELIETQKQSMETTIEISHRGAYKGHQMGLPILGKISNIMKITRDMIVDYHQTNYYGENLIVIGCGDHKHEDLVDLVSKHFNKVPRKSPNPIQNLNNFTKPQFCSEFSLIQSDIHPDHLNISFLQEAPSWSDPDYFAFLLIQRIIGDKPESPLDLEITNYSELNSFQKELITFPNIQVQKGVYTPYADTALYGNYYFGNKNCLKEAYHFQQNCWEALLENLNDIQIERAKKKLYIELFNHETGNDISQAIGNHILYLNRRIFRSEIAYRIANLSKEDIAKTIQKWCIQKPYSITVWGDTQDLEKQIQG